MIFLLGGHDLEMAEIRRIVIECKDYGLSWNNAISSAYSKITNQKANSDGGDDGFFGISGKAIDIQFIDKITKQRHGCI